METITAAVITGVFSLLVAWVAAKYAKDAAIEGAKKQIQFEKNKLDGEMKENREFALNVTKKFLIREIQKNLSMLNKALLNNTLRSNVTPPRFGLGTDFEFLEYDRFKKDLLRFKSEEIETIFAVYDMFKLVAIHKDLRNFSQEEYQKFKKDLPGFYKEFGLIERLEK